MKKHLTKHTGEKKHKCAQCDKGFDLASGLKLHSQLSECMSLYTVELRHTFVTNVENHLLSLQF